MGSARRPPSRQYLAFLGLNVLVSAATVAVVLAIWGGRARPIPPTPSATPDILARLATAVPSPTTTVPPSPTPNTYTVRQGDTLFGIALELGVSLEDLMAANGLSNPDSLAVGQVLVIPSRSGGAAPTRPPGPSGTATPSLGADPPRVEIRGVDGAGVLEVETVRILNQGGTAAMAGWTLEDGAGNVYTFPDFTLHTGAVSVHTRAGTDTVIDLYWGLSFAVWTPGKVITLSDASGAVRSTFSIP